MRLLNAYTHGGIMFKKILVPVDGSELSARAAKTAIAIAKEQGASVLFVHATKPFLYPYAAEYPVYDTVSEKLYNERATQFAKSVFAEVKAVAAREAVNAESLAESAEHPDEFILRTVAEKNCDLIVIATHGRGAVSRLFMGSVTMRLLPRSPVPVLVYRDESMALSSG
jgi:nucleotide-binding universal stress UspA family protein